MKILKEGTRAILIFVNDRGYSTIHNDTHIKAIDYGTEEEQRYIGSNGSIFIHSPVNGWHALEVIEIK